MCKLSYQIQIAARYLSPSLITVNQTEDSESFMVGQQVIYIPSHLEGEHKKPVNWKYPNGIQPGFIVKRSKDEQFFWVRYWQWDLEKKEYVMELRTKANSEQTPEARTFYFEFFPEERVRPVIMKLMEEINAS